MSEAIPDKLFYKLNEVCQYTDTQPYVLRFWESEFPQLAPEKHKNGQRVYRRQDIDLILKIKKLLYEEEYTIAGARKKLQNELRESSRLKIVPNEPVREPLLQPLAPLAAEDFDDEIDELEGFESAPVAVAPKFDHQKPVDSETPDRRQALTDLASQLLELRELLKRKRPEETASFLRKY